MIRRPDAWSLPSGPSSARGGPRMMKPGERIVVSARRAPGPDPLAPEPVEETVAPDTTVWHQLLELLFGPLNSP